MPADRPDFPALQRLTADVSDAMRAAETAERAAADRRRWWRRSLPLAVALLALALPAAGVLHATSGKADERPVAPLHHAVIATECGATVAIAALAATGASLSRRDGSPTPMTSLRPCA
ncbi:hypothetical protein [Baekduia sp. Peel2402]|uniref:hypothetical protein n=1 Tax=Baekduia sp. Peel2402 TaxID=3458296 RepID=UPI00403E9E8B